MNPPEGGWSIAQVFEHLCVADEAYLPLLERLVRAPNAPRRDTADVAWRPRWGGKLLMGALSRPRKVKAPKRFRIGPNVRDGVITEFFATIPRGLALIMTRPLTEREVRICGMALKESGGVLLLGVHVDRHRPDRAGTPSASPQSLAGYRRDFSCSRSLRCGTYLAAHNITE